MAQQQLWKDETQNRKCNDEAEIIGGEVLEKKLCRVNR